MSAWLWLGLAAVLCFGAVLLRGAPYLPTKRRQINAGLDLLNLRPGQTVIDLGSGDGAVLKVAAERGLRGIGYELNPLLWLAAKLRLWRHRAQVQVVWGDFWQRDFSQADGVFVFLISHHMARLEEKLAELPPHTPVVSVAFRLPNTKPMRQKSGVYLYQPGKNQ